MKSNTFQAGDMVYFGALMDRAIKWRVLSVDGGDALVTTCHAVSAQPYNRVDGPVDWENCYLRRWLNETFLQSAFSDREREKIRSVTHADKDAQISFSEERTADRVFVLSEEEARRYFADPEDRTLLFHGQAPDVWSVSRGLRQTCCWWLRGRSVEINGKNGAAYCDYGGGCDGWQRVDSAHIGVRPALWVDQQALRPAREIGNLNIRLKQDAADSITLFRYGREEKREVYARFVDYETQGEYVLYHEGGYDPYPRVARIEADEAVGSVMEKKAEELIALLCEMPRGRAAELLQRRMDEERVKNWMNQVAWAPTGREEWADVEEGDVIRLGRTEGKNGREPLNWILLLRSGSKALLVAEKGLRCDAFMGDDDEWNCRWEKSKIREWLNGPFYKKSFSEKEKYMIQRCMTDTGDILGRVQEEGMAYDWVFLLSDAEAATLFPSDEARKLSGTPDDVSLIRDENATGDWWWLRSPGDRGDRIACVDPDGRVDREGCEGYCVVCAVRPAILVDLMLYPGGNGSPCRAISAANRYHRSRFAPGAHSPAWIRAADDEELPF